MPRTILGKVSLTPKGEYNPGTAYTALDVVGYGGSSWLALKDVTGVTPVDGENWMLLAAKGDQGASFTRLEKTAGTGAPGTIDTYTAYNSEGTQTGTINVYNGMDGLGVGDFKADGTVPMTGDLQMGQHKVTGVADPTEDTDGATKGYVDQAVEGVTVTTDATPTQDSTNPVQSGGVYTALAGKADLILSNLSNYQKALAAIGGKPRDNLLDNCYFVGGGSQQGGGQFPINQRGQTSYAVAATAIDRWRIPGDGGTLTIEEEGITYQNATENTAYLLEHLPLATIIPGSQYTMSVLFGGGSNTKAAEFVCYRPGSPGYSVFTGDAVVGAGISSVTFTIPEDTTSIEARMVTGPYGTYGNFTAIAAKLEPGPTQTLAYQDEDGNWQLFETPDYEVELIKCQRYLRVYNNGGRIRTWNTRSDTTNAYNIVNIVFDRPMRITPSGTVTYRIDDGTSLTADLYTDMCGPQKITPNVAGIAPGSKIDIVSYTVSAEL